MSTVAFELHPGGSGARYGPRLGRVKVIREGGAHTTVPTPGFVASTSRGAVPHLSRDNLFETEAVRGALVSLDSFLEQSPPVPTMYPSKTPMHSFLGYSPERHLLMLTVRAPSDCRITPPNEKDLLQVWTGNGVRKHSLAKYREFMDKCGADIVIAPADTPYTNAPFSQKRLTKSIDRGAQWLADFLKLTGNDDRPRSVLVSMAGATNAGARSAFARQLLDRTDDPRGRLPDGAGTLADAVAGFSFDLAHLCWAAPEEAAQPGWAAPLLRASLDALPVGKLRVVHGARGPHDTLALVRTVGADVFDAGWAQRAADWGVALDFTFPPPPGTGPGRRDLGHNLYDAAHAHDHGPLARVPCVCLACAPARRPALSHSALAEPRADADSTPRREPYSRAYLHHLLHTHEMGAHALLAAHNLTVLDGFFAAVRAMLAEGQAVFDAAAEAFMQGYDGSLAVLERARDAWKEVDLARGKGRLAREKAKQAEALG